MSQSLLAAVLGLAFPVLAYGQNRLTPHSKLPSQISENLPGQAAAWANPTDKAQARPLPANLARGILEEEGNLNLRAAIRNYQAVVADFDEQRRYAATALFRLGECYRKLGQTNEAQAQFLRVLHEFADQQPLALLSQQSLTALGLSRTSEAAITNEVVAAAAQEEQDEELRRIRALQRNSPDLINAAGKNGETLLASAAAKGHTEVVRFLLDHGAAINGLKQPELTPLHYAAGNGRLAVVNLLLSRGAKFEAVTSSGVTPLHLAADKGYTHVTKALLDAGASAQALTQRSTDWDGPDLQYKLAAGASPVDLAIANGYAAIVELMLDHGLDVNAPGPSSGTPLHVAASAGQMTIAELLIHRGAKINQQDVNGNTPLHLAAASGHLSTVQALLRAKADPNVQNKSGETPLLIAAKIRQPEEAEALLEAGANANLATTGQIPGLTPLQFAVAAGNVRLARDLLVHGADPNLRAARPGYNFPPTSPSKDQILYEQAATPLEIACGLNDSAMVKLLLEHGADPNTRSGKENSPLLLSLYDRPPLLQMFLEHKADPDLANQQGNTPLHFVVHFGNTNGLALLIEHGANVNARNTFGDTPLHYAVSAGRLDMVEALLAAKADPNLMNNQEKTPLDLAKAQQTSPSRSNPPLARSDGNPPRPATPAEIAAALLRGGALEEIPHPDQIAVSRPSAFYSQALFRKGPMDACNRYTLMELIADWYGLISTSQEWRLSSRFSIKTFVSKYSHPYDQFPDFSHITIRRPSNEGHQWSKQQIDLSGPLKSDDCTANIPLQWGDVVEIPEADHPVNETWPGLSNPVLATLKNCLTRQVQLTVKGQRNQLVLSPDILFDAQGQPESIGPEVPFMLRPALLRSGLILSSSDLTRVKVSRADPTGQAQQWVLNCSDAKTAPDFWLRDGDRIEVPEK